MDVLIKELAERVRQASAERKPLRIRGGGTKDFYGYRLEGDVLDVSCYRGIVDYEPSELVITAKAGTPLAEIEQTLGQGGQMLAFEPPHYGAGTTLGGCVATGFSGPRRAQCGSVRDFVLGTRVLDSKGDDLRFGGQVMKNVAGFDVSRLMAGSFGTLAMILEVSLKVLPRPEEEVTLRFETDEANAIQTMNRWAGQPLPISATCYSDGVLSVRLSGSTLAVEAARSKLGGELEADAASFWSGLRDHKVAALEGGLWRLSIKSTAPPVKLPGPQIIEWNGSLRWLQADASADEVFAAGRKAGGYATRFRGEPGTDVMRLEPGVLALQKRIKLALDPNNVFGRHRLHAEF